MKASESKLQQILEGTKQYVVPLYQRTYSWKKSEWEIFWNDLLELYERDNPRPHFLGSIVTMPITSVPEGINKYLLIDGQQRLTTIFILLSVIRDAATKSEENETQISEEINDTFLVNRFKKNLDRYKLQPTKKDCEAFYHIIQSQSLIPESIISECYSFFEKKIKQIKIDLEKLKQVVCSNLSIISIVLNQDDDPYLVFESLNAKGKSLTQADLIRNYFFMLINEENQETVYTHSWYPMETLLEDNLTEFIRHYLTKDGREVKQNDVYFEIKSNINQNNVHSKIENIVKFSEYYSKLINPDLEENEKIRNSLLRLNRLEVLTIYPFLLNCYDDWKESKITGEDFQEILQTLENFLLRRFVCNVQTRGLNRIFSVLYSQISKEITLNSNKLVEQLKLSLQTHDYPNDIEFKKNLVTIKLYGGNRSEKGKIILESLEKSFNHKEQVSLDKVSIEHIMPQTITSWWKIHLGEDWAITHDLLVHTIGNLTLTGYNPELYNGDFYTKKNHFKKSHVNLNQYFSDKDCWRREDIETRSEYLADIALQIWSFFGDDSIYRSQTSNSTGTTPQRLQFLRKEHSVKNWRDVLETTLNVIHDVRPDGFEEIIKKFPRFLSWEENKFRQSRKLKNGAFIEVNLSAKDIYTFCQKAIETAKIPREEWIIESY